MASGRVPDDPKLRLLLLRRLFARCHANIETGCWEWLGAKAQGYGLIGTPNESGNYYVHIVSYSIFVGSVPAGLDLDHLCRTRACFNPDHLDPVTRNENLRRRIPWTKHSRPMHCPKGHFYDQINGRVSKSGTISCRTCARVACAASRAKLSPEERQRRNRAAYRKHADKRRAESRSRAAEQRAACTKTCERCGGHVTKQAYRVCGQCWRNRKGWNKENGVLSITIPGVEIEVTSSPRRNG